MFKGSHAFANGSVWHKFIPTPDHHLEGQIFEISAYEAEGCVRVIRRWEDRY